MAAQELGHDSFGLAFLVSAGIVYEIIAAACSSPQTAEINADKRGDTLMKWVNLGLLQAGVFIGLAAFFDRKNWAPIVLGGGIAGFIMWVQYIHALETGLKSTREGTES